MSNGIDSKVNNIFLLLSEGLDLISIVILIIHQFLILVNVVQHMSQTHLGLYPLFLDLLWVCQSALFVKLLLDGRQQLETILGRIMFHILEEMTVYHAQGQLLKGLYLFPVHR